VAIQSDSPADHESKIGLILRSPLTIALGVLGAIAGAFQVAGVPTMLLAKILLVAGVWALITIEVCSARWLRRTGRYAFSIILVTFCISGLISVLLSAAIAQLKAN